MSEETFMTQSQPGTEAQRYREPTNPPQAPMYPPQPPPGQPTSRPYNGYAIASMVLGIGWLCGITSILALVFGYLAKRQIAESSGWQQGDGFATAGIVLGWVGVGSSGLWIIIAAISAATGT